jgi:hypothetical protein
MTNWLKDNMITIQPIQGSLERAIRNMIGERIGNENNVEVTLRREDRRERGNGNNRVKECYRKLIDECYGTRSFERCYQDFQEKNQDECEELFGIVMDSKCPTVKYEDDDYWMYMMSRKEWKSTGKNREYVKMVYGRNYPNCGIPEILREKRVKRDECPYNFEERNPCNQKECEGVNWKDVRNIGKINEECKREMVHYCETYKEMDPNCICWGDDKKDDRRCIQYRRMLGDRRAVECSAGDFSIQEHPDYEDYIKKDRIPCWGCKV